MIIQQTFFSSSAASHYMHPPQLSIVHIHCMCMPQHTCTYAGEVSVCHVYKFGHTAVETIFGGFSKYLLQRVPSCTNLLLTVPVGTQS